MEEDHAKAFVHKGTEGQCHNSVIGVVVQDGGHRPLGHSSLLCRQQNREVYNATLEKQVPPCAMILGAVSVVQEVLSRD